MINFKKSIASLLSATLIWSCLPWPALAQFGMARPDAEINSADIGAGTAELGLAGLSVKGQSQFAQSLVNLTADMPDLNNKTLSQAQAQKLMASVQQMISDPKTKASDIAAAKTALGIAANPNGVMPQLDSDLKNFDAHQNSTLGKQAIDGLQALARHARENPFLQTTAKNFLARLNLAISQSPEIFFDGTLGSDAANPGPGLMNMAAGPTLTATSGSVLSKTKTTLLKARLKKISDDNSSLFAAQYRNRNPETVLEVYAASGGGIYIEQWLKKRRIKYEPFKERTGRDFFVIKASNISKAAQIGWELTDLQEVRSIETESELKSKIALKANAQMRKSIILDEHMIAKIAKEISKAEPPTPGVASQQTSAAKRFHIDWGAAVGVVRKVSRRIWPLALAAVVVTTVFFAPGIANAAVLPLATRATASALPISRLALFAPMAVTAAVFSASLSRMMGNSAGGALDGLRTNYPPTIIGRIGTGKKSSGKKGFHFPGKAAVGPDGRIYVADFANYRVQIFAADRTYLDTMRGTGQPISKKDQFRQPDDIAVGRNGRIYVADHSTGQIQMYNPDKTHFGTITAPKGSYFDIRGIAIGPDRRLYEADGRYNRINIFNEDGIPADTIPTGDTSPVAITVDGKGCMYVVDRIRNKLFIFNQDGTLLDTIGSGQKANSNKDFSYPDAVTVDGNGRIYVGDAGNYRIQVFNQDRTYRTTIEIKHKNKGAYDIGGSYRISTGPDDRIYVADTYNHQILIFNSWKEIRKEEEAQFNILKQSLLEKAESPAAGEVNPPQDVSAAKRFHIDWGAAVGIVKKVSRRIWPLALAAVVVVTAGLLSPGISQAAVLPLMTPIIPVAAHAGASTLAALTTLAMPLAAVLGVAAASRSAAPLNASLSPSQGSVLSGSSKMPVNGVIRHWPNSVLFEPNDQKFERLAFSPDGKYLITVNERGRVAVWDAETLQLIKQIDSSEYVPFYTNKVTPANPFLYILNGTNIKIKPGTVVLHRAGTAVPEQTHIFWGQQRIVLDHTARAARTKDNRFASWLEFVAPSNKLIIRNLTGDVNSEDKLEQVAKELSNSAKASSAHQSSSAPSAEKRFKIDWDAAVWSPWHNKQ